jgi:hypothetical protein
MELPAQTPFFVLTLALKETFLLNKKLFFNSVLCSPLKKSCRKISFKIDYFISTENKKTKRFIKNLDWKNFIFLLILYRINKNS